MRDIDDSETARRRVSKTESPRPRLGRVRGFWKLVSRIFVENSASLALHERCGFRVVGVYQRHGKLDD